MKRLCMFLTAILLFTLIKGEAQLKKESDGVSVSTPLQPFFKRFVTLIEENQIPIDWSKVNAVVLMPLAENVQGYYSIDAKTVVINSYFQLPRVKTTVKEQEDLIFITLAHEIGHSQGWGHNTNGRISLMNPTSKYDLLVIRGSIGADNYVISEYKKRKSPN